ncbi:MAG: hypothetical protein RL169_1226 [Armatimonadota bacterium]
MNGSEGYEKIEPTRGKRQEVTLNDLRTRPGLRWGGFFFVSVVDSAKPGDVPIYKHFVNGQVRHVCRLV